MPQSPPSQFPILPPPPKPHSLGRIQTMLLRRLLRKPPSPPPPCTFLPAATFIDAKIKWVRDRGLDHAVEKEKHLRPLHALKNLLLHPSHNPLPLSLSSISDLSSRLRLPFRAIRFIRKYPSVFLEQSSSSDPILQQPFSLDPNPRLPFSPEPNLRQPNSPETNLRLPISPEKNQRLPNSPEMNLRLPNSPETNLELTSSPEKNLHQPNSPEMNLRLPISPETNLRLPISPEMNLRRPVILPMPELVRLHEEEQMVYQSTQAETADRLLRLLMMTPQRRIPLTVISKLSWELGLRDDFARSLLPLYPDYFRVIPSESTDSLDLELVCWNDELAVSAMENRARKTGGYRKGDSLAFPMVFPRGFSLEKKIRNWVEEWQRLPYLSPYEDSGRCLDPSSPLAEKWTVGMLHELLSLMIGKKAEKEELVLLGECVGLRPGFKKEILRFPGIFYLSNKNRTHTVVLREGYKRDILVEKHPLMAMRFQYIRLMRQSAAGDAASAPAHGAAAEDFVREDEELG
ncbi:uncharacterized protein LOC144704904 [Wolffia australiana]